MADPDRLKLGKGTAFVKSRIARLPACEEVWEADFRALPQPLAQSETHYVGLVATKKGGHLLADLSVHGKPSVNDLATLLAHAMRRPLDGEARRPRTVNLKAARPWRELIAALEGLGIGVAVERKLAKIDGIFRALLAEFRASQRARMVQPDARQAQVEALFPAIARYVRGHGHIEIGNQEGSGFVARAIGYGGIDFEDTAPELLAEAMAALEAGLAAWFEEMGLEPD